MSNANSPKEDTRTKLHANAALSLKKRLLLSRRVVEQGWSLSAAAAAAAVSERTAGKWVGRYRADGELGLLDRSSAPNRVANRTTEQRVEAIAALRRLRFTGAQIAELLEMAETTVSGILTRIGLGRLGRLGLEHREAEVLQASLARHRSRDAAQLDPVRVATLIALQSEARAKDVPRNKRSKNVCSLTLRLGRPAEGLPQLPVLEDAA